MGDKTSLGYFEGPAETVIEALIAAELDGATLELVTDVADELEAFIAARGGDIPEYVQAGPIQLGHGPTRLAIEGDDLERIRAIVAGGETPLALTVRDAGGVLVHAPDVGDGEVWVSDRVAADAVDRMRAVLGDGLRPAARD